MAAIAALIAATAFLVRKNRRSENARPRDEERMYNDVQSGVPTSPAAPSSIPLGLAEALCYAAGYELPVSMQRCGYLGKWRPGAPPGSWLGSQAKGSWVSAMEESAGAAGDARYGLNESDGSLSDSDSEFDDSAFTSFSSPSTSTSISSSSSLISSLSSILTAAADRDLQLVLGGQVSAVEFNHRTGQARHGPPT